MDAMLPSDAIIQNLKMDIQQLQDEVVELQAENKDLKENLLEFGRHSEGCNYPVNEKYGCRCGWLEIENKLKESEV